MKLVVKGTKPKLPEKKELLGQWQLYGAVCHRQLQERSCGY